MVKEGSLYKVKEIFYSIQGEGFHAGRPAVFCRFSGCNLWSGREEDRKTAICSFCDTDFVGTEGSYGGKYSAEELAGQIVALWPDPAVPPFVVLTGGEPMLQLDEQLAQALKAYGVYSALETNGTLEVPPIVDWVTVSPKAGAKWIQRSGNELKLIYPQPHNNTPEYYYSHGIFDHYLLQPMDGLELKSNTRAALKYCLTHPHWRISLQQHKLLGVP